MTKSAFKEILEDVLRVPRGSLKDSDSRETLSGWDSVADIQILALIAGESGTETDAELLYADTIGDLLNMLEDRRVLAD